MAFLQFDVTVSAASITIDDLGGIVLTTGTVDLGQRYQIEELRYSKDLAFHIHAGNAIATDSVGRVINNSGGATLPQVETRLNRAGHIFNTDELDEGLTNLYFTEAAARASIGIDPTSEQFMNYDSNTGLLSVTNLLITSVDVDTVETSLTTWVTANYNTSLDYQEGDVVILTAATGGSQTWINNGGTALTIADWTEIQGPDLSDSYIRGLISGTAPISYNNTTGVITLLYDNDTITLTGSNQIQVNEAALTITASQVSDFATAVNTEIFEATNFVDSASIDFTVTVGTSVTAIVIDNSITAAKLAVTGNGTSGQILASNGDGTFSWVADQNTEYTAGTGLTLTGTEFDVLYDNDSIKVNTAGELYVDESALTSLQKTFESGLTETTGTVRLGGALTQNTVIDGNEDYSLSVEGATSINLTTDAGASISLGSTEGTIESPDGEQSISVNDSGIEVTAGNNNGLTLSGTNTEFTGQIQVGDFIASGTEAAGMIRWNATNFQGYNGTTWVNLDTQGSTPTAGTGIDITAVVISIADTTVTAGSYGSASAVATFTVNAQGQLTAAASTSISITASQVSDFNTAASAEIFDAANFVDGTTIDFTVTSGASVTAEVAIGSLTEDYLSINTPSTGTTGDILTSDGLGNFEWTDAATYTKKSWTWGAASNAFNHTNRFLDRHDGAPTNLTPYVSWYNCELKAISMTQVGTVAWTAEVYVNGASVATLASGSVATAFSVLATAVAINAGDRVSFYVNGTAVNRPAIDAMFETV